MTMKKKMTILFTGILAALLSSGCAETAEPFVPETHPAYAEGEGGYLWAHMTHNNYYKLFYAVSRDAFNWTTLNDGQIIDMAYEGHPDICLGPDGVYRMIAVHPLRLYSSRDLVTWTKTPLDPEIFEREREYGYTSVSDYGAPKMCYDPRGERYIITWHASKGMNEDGTAYNDWDTMTTFYVTTKDFETFTFPQKLFPYFDGDDKDMAMIDTILREVDGKFYAILKDERKVDVPLPLGSPDTGKSIRICTGDNILGPYTNPGPSIVGSNKMWLEAPIFVELPHGSGYAIFMDSYHESPFGYIMFRSETMEGPWLYRNIKGPNVLDGTDRPGAVHGCIVKVPEEIYQGILKAYLK